MKKTIIAAILAISATPALAGSNETPAPEMAPAVAQAPISTGTDWTGGYAGLQLGFGQVDAGAGSGQGLIGGLHGGYLMDLGSTVVGGELDYDMTDITVSGIDIDSVTRLKLKAGADMGQFMAYGTVGAAYADASTLGQDYGWLLGAGVDYLLSSNMSVGTELLYHRFDDFDGTGTDVTATTLTAKVAFHF